MRAPHPTPAEVTDELEVAQRALRLVRSIASVRTSRAAQGLEDLVSRLVDARETARLSLPMVKLVKDVQVGLPPAGRPEGVACAVCGKAPHGWRRGVYCSTTCANLAIATGAPRPPAASP